MLKVGIIGCGGFAQHHVDGFARTGRAAVTAAWSRNPEHCQDAATRWSAKAYDSAEALIKSDVDIIALCTPGFARLEYIELAARAGKHVLCEKPVALTLADAQAIRDIVKQTGITFMVGFNLRFDPALRRMRAIQESGQIGQTVTAWYRVHAPAPSSRWRDIQATGHWRSSPTLSGGRIAEFGGHGINWLIWTLGIPASVYGKALHVTEGFTVDDADCAILTCRNGVGTVDLHRHGAIAERFSCGIVGHTGSVAFEQGKVQFTPMDSPTVELPPETGFAGKHDHFLDCIANGQSPLNDVDDAIWTLRTCLAFNRSSESGAAVEINDSSDRTP